MNRMGWKWMRPVRGDRDVNLAVPADWVMETGRDMREGRIFSVRGSL